MLEIYTLIAGIVISLVSIILILGKRPSEVQKWYLLATVGMLVYLVANYVKRHDGDPSVYMYFQQIIYFATAVFNGAFVLGTAEALGLKRHKALRRFYYGLIIADCLLVMTLHSHHAFYKEIVLFPNPDVQGLFKSNVTENWLYKIYNTFKTVLKLSTSAYLLAGIVRKKGDKKSKMRMFAVLVVVLTLPLLSKAMNIIAGFSTALPNHTFYILTTLSMLILIEHYEVTVTLPIIKEQAIEQSSDGIVILDKDRTFQYANDTAEALFPALAGDDPDEVTAFVGRELSKDRVSRNDREYEIHVDEQMDKTGRPSGYLMILRDVTERELAKRAEQELRASEMKLATSIQASVLPSAFPAFHGRTDFDIHASMDPAKEVGGDFYDFFLIDDDHLAMVIADVSGKGIPAALFMMVSKALIQNQLMSGSDPAQALQRVNAQLCERNDAKMFVTVWAAVLELSTGEGLACNAGHENPAIRREGGRYELLAYRHNMFMGVSKKAKYMNRPFHMNRSDSLFVYTDGVTEAHNREGEMFGTERLEAALNMEAGAGPERLIDNVRSTLSDFVQDAAQFDDVTMLAMQYRGMGESGEALRAIADRQQTENIS